MLLGINSHGQYNHYIKDVESYKDNFWSYHLFFLKMLFGFESMKNADFAVSELGNN